MTRKLGRAEEGSKMKSFRSYLAAGVGFAMLVTIIFLATGWGSAVAAQVTSVFVTNPANNPAQVHEAGTANVNVTNTTVPVHEQGTATVSVSGTPSVNVTNSTLPVHEQGTATVHVDNSALSVSPQAASTAVTGSINLPANNGTAHPFKGSFDPVDLTLLTIDAVGTGEVNLWNINGGGPSTPIMVFGIGSPEQTMVLPFATPLTVDRIGLQCFSSACGVSYNAVYR